MAAPQPARISWEDLALTAGERLRARRHELKLTMRDVYLTTVQIAKKEGDNEEFIVRPSRLSDVEIKGQVPNIYRLYSLAVVYDISLLELLSWYGIHCELMPKVAAHATGR